MTVNERTVCIGIRILSKKFKINYNQLIICILILLSSHNVKYNYHIVQLEKIGEFGSKY